MPAGSPAIAQETVRIGVIAEFSGPFADYGAQIVAGMKTYLKLNGEVYGGKKIELILRDTTGAAPDIAKRLAQELVTRDNVDILAGFGPHPERARRGTHLRRGEEADGDHECGHVGHHDALRLTSSASRTRCRRTRSRWRSVRRRTASSGCSRSSPISVRASTRKTTFVKAFKGGGREIVDSVRSPLSNNDFAPVPAADQGQPPGGGIRLPSARQPDVSASSRVTRSAVSSRLGIRIIATGDLTDDGVLQAMGEPTLGLITSFHYSAAHDSPENKVFIKAYVETNGTRLRPNFMACAGYDGMAAIAEALKIDRRAPSTRRSSSRRSKGCA